MRNNRTCSGPSARSGCRLPACGDGKTGSRADQWPSSDTKPLHYPGFIHKNDPDRSDIIVSRWISGGNPLTGWVNSQCKNQDWQIELTHLSIPLYRLLRWVKIQRKSGSILLDNQHLLVFYNTLVIVRNCNWRDKLYISWEMTLTSIGGEKQAGISGGSQSPQLI